MAKLVKKVGIKNGATRDVRVFDEKVYEQYLFPPCQESETEKVAQILGSHLPAGQLRRIKEYNVTSDIVSLIPNSTIILSTRQNSMDGRITRIAPSDISLRDEYLQQHGLSLGILGNLLKDAGRIVFVRVGAMQEERFETSILNLAGPKMRLLKPVDLELVRAKKDRKRARYEDNKRYRHELYG